MANESGMQKVEKSLLVEMVQAIFEKTVAAYTAKNVPKGQASPGEEEVVILDELNEEKMAGQKRTRKLIQEAWAKADKLSVSEGMLPFEERRKAFIAADNALQKSIADLQVKLGQQP
jgi:hypothetical protein